MKWFYEVGIINLNGYNSCGIIDSEEETEYMMEDIIWERAVANAESYFMVIEPRDQDIFEHDGEEYLRTFIFYEDIFSKLEPYMPEIHDEKLKQNREKNNYGNN